MRAMTAIGIDTVPGGGAVGATANVAGAPSTWSMSALPKDPVQPAGVLIVTLPVTRSMSPGSWVHVPPSTGTLVVAPCGAVTDAVARARAMMAARPSEPARPVGPAGPAGPRGPRPPGPPLGPLVKPASVPPAGSAL